jgi:hypothetical protein
MVRGSNPDVGWRYISDFHNVQCGFGDNAVGAWSWTRGGAVLVLCLYSFATQKGEKKFLFGFLGRQGIYNLLNAQLRLHMCHVTSYRWLSAIMAQPENCPFGVNAAIELNNNSNCIRRKWHLAGCVSTDKCAGIVVCSCHIFEISRSINSKWANFGLCHYCIQCALSTSEWRVGHRSGRRKLIKYRMM